MRALLYVRAGKPTQSKRPATHPFLNGPAGVASDGNLLGMVQHGLFMTLLATNLTHNYNGGLHYIAIVDDPARKRTVITYSVGVGNFL